MKRCTKCIMPETKPDLTFDDQGVCSACRNYEGREKVDWAEREGQLRNILQKYRTPGYYDCIVPVSGGKDSHFQVLTMLEMNMHPLAVCARTDDFSDIGRRNLENLKKLGVDCVEVSVNPLVRKKIAKYALQQVGDISWAEHVTIFTTPVRLAVQFNIPLLIWGENPQNEYGGPAAASEDQVLTKDWLQTFGGLLGLYPEDLTHLGISKKDLLMYTYPENEDLERSGVTGLFLGHFLPWDGMENAKLAKKHGFEWYREPVENTYKPYENLDNYQTGIHDYLKYLKYGYGRATDMVCTDIRRGRMTREDGIRTVKALDGKVPNVYLGKPLYKTLKGIDMTIDEFHNVCRNFANEDIFDIQGGQFYPKFEVE